MRDTHSPLENPIVHGLARRSRVEAERVDAEGHVFETGAVTGVLRPRRRRRRASEYGRPEVSQGCLRPHPEGTTYEWPHLAKAWFLVVSRSTRSRSPPLLEPGSQHPDVPVVETEMKPELPPFRDEGENSIERETRGGKITRIPWATPVHLAEGGACTRSSST